MILNKFAITTIAFSWTLLMGFSCEAQSNSAAVAVQHAISAPNFTLSDIHGKKHQLSDYRGRPVVMFFFCGCQWCRDCARTWGQIQKSGALDSDVDASKRPITLVVFSGGSSAAQQFEFQNRLDPVHTVMLCDESMNVSLGLYHAEICPRVFVLDAKANVSYTNTHRTDAPRIASAEQITSRALSAVVALDASKY